jgi:ABC-type amino acid transport substrate-binding protein
MNSMTMIMISCAPKKLFVNSSKHLKRLLGRFGSALALLFFISSINTVKSQQLSGTDWANAVSSKSANLTVVYYPEQAFAFKDARGNYTGVELDILNQFFVWLKNAKGINVNVTYKEQGDFDKLLSSVKNSNGGVFGAGNVTITDERKKDFKYSPAYLNNIAVLMTHSSAPELKTLEAISALYKSYSAVVHKGTTHVITLNNLKDKYYPNLKIGMVNSDDEAIKSVIENSKLFTYTDLANYWMAQKDNQPVKRQAIGDKTTEQFGFIMPKNSGWDQAFNEFFNLGAGYRSNIMYKKILMRHLGNEVTQMLEMALAQQNQSNK